MIICSWWPLKNRKKKKKGCYRVIDLVICTNITNLLFALIAPQAARHQQKPTEGGCGGDECTEFCNMFSRKINKQNKTTSIPFIKWNAKLHTNLHHEFSPFSSQMKCQDSWGVRTIQFTAVCCVGRIATSMSLQLWGYPWNSHSGYCRDTEHSIQWTECVAWVQGKRKRDFAEGWQGPTTPKSCSCIQEYFSDSSLSFHFSQLFNSCQQTVVNVETCRDCLNLQSLS